MKQGLLLKSPCHNFPLILFPIPRPNRLPVTSATLNSSVSGEYLTARERRQLRNERRENKSATTPNWREEVEVKLLKKPKKRYASWKEELNLDNLALLGPQWWVVRVSRVRGQEIAERLARSLARNYPDIDFKVYVPSVQVKRRLKNGSISVKPKALFPGCVFLNCVLNKEVHDFIREYDGIGGFVGSKVGNMKKQINKPRPVSNDDLEAIIRQAKEEQVKADQDFENEQLGEALTSEKLDESQLDLPESITSSKPKGKSKKSSKSLEIGSQKDAKRLVPGSTVRIVSGTFKEFSGSLKKFSRKTGKATVRFALFGKENLLDFDVNEIDIVTDTE